MNGLVEGQPCLYQLFYKFFLFLEPKKEGDLFLSTQQVNESVRDGAEVFMLVASLKLSENGTMG